MRGLAAAIFLFGPVRIGRFGFAIQRRPIRPQVYRATYMWVSLDIFWFRFYWWSSEALDG